MKHFLLVTCVLACHPSARVAADRHAAIVAELVGTWSGTAEGTPFGDFPIALAFERRGDGSVQARLDAGDGMYLQFAFRPHGRAWELAEDGALPGVGVQSHRLLPTGEREWSDGALTVALALRDDALEWTTTLRGRPHAVFRLTRARGATSAHRRQTPSASPQ